jgi:hypothetical protein
MATLLTLAEAKTHLRITDDDHDTDITQKALEASEIIQNYLGNPLTQIASVSVDDPAEITTRTPHGLVNGVTYTIAGTDTEPDITGARVVTVTGRYTFTIPLEVTAGESDSDGTVSTAAWTDTNVPAPIKAATKLMLSHLYDHRGDEGESEPSEAIWTAITRLLMRYRDPVLA